MKQVPIIPTPVFYTLPEEVRPPRRGMDYGMPLGIPCRRKSARPGGALGYLAAASIRSMIVSMEFCCGEFFIASM